MGDIIRVDFVNRKLLPPEEELSQAEGGGQSDAGSGFESKAAMQDFLDQSTSGMDLDYLRQIKTSRNDIDIALGDLASVGDRELIRILAGSSKKDWDQKPAYYLALYYDILRRLKKL